jgi:CIC family chloride channel protein
MERDVTLLPKDTRLETFLRQGGHEGRMKHIVVSEGDRIVGVLRVNTALRRGIEDLEQQGFTLGEIAQRNYTVAREEDIVFDVVTRMTRHNAGMAVVSKAKRRPRITDVLGVITKEHIADSVAQSIKPYGE